MEADERERYGFPVVRVIPAGGPYFRMPWEKIYKVSIATETISMAHDPESSTANRGGTVLEAVTKDQLNIGIMGQIRYRPAERNLYAYLFGVSKPLEHVMGYFISVLRERIANFVDPKGQGLIGEDELQGEGGGTAVDLSEGVSINDLRKNLPLLNDYMEQQCRGTVGRYGIELDAALITATEKDATISVAGASM